MALFPLSLEFWRTGTKPAEGLGDRRVAYGKTVWSWRPDAGVKFAEAILRMTVARKPGHRGEHGISRNTIACGNAG
jgi:hypothetical protein